MPQGWPAAPSVQTVTDKLATISPTKGNVAGYYVWLVEPDAADESLGAQTTAPGAGVYGPSSVTDAQGNWSIPNVPASKYVTFFGARPERWEHRGKSPYLVALNPPIRNGRGLMAPAGNRIAFAGDSCVGSATSVWVPDDGSHNLNAQGKGWPTFGCFMANQRILWANACSSTGGLTSSGLSGASGTITTTILPVKPHACVIMVGHNDASGAVLNATYQANIHAACQLLIANGIVPVLSTVYPDSTGSAPTNKLILQYNQFLKAYGRENGLFVLDMNPLIADPAGALGGGMLSAYNLDNVHANEAGQFQMGPAMSDAAFLNLFPSNFPYFTTVTADATNLLANGVMQGAGPAATSWTAGGGTGDTDSVIAGTDGIIGNWQKTVSAAATGTHQIQQTGIATGWVAGDRLAYSGRFKGSGNVAGGAKWSAYVYGNGGANQGFLAKPMSLWQYCDTVGSFYGEFTVPSGITSLQVGFERESGAAGTGQFGQVTLVNLTTLAIVPNGATTPTGIPLL